MGHIDTLPAKEPQSKYPSLPPDTHDNGPKKSHWLVWLVLLVIVGGGLYWYYRGNGFGEIWIRC